MKRRFFLPFLLAAVVVSMAQVATVINTRRLNLLHAGGANCTLISGSGTPEGNVVGKPCDAYLRSDAPAWYVKGAGTGTDNSGWATTTGSGTVTSVAATVPTFLSIAGSPVTTSGTLAITLSGTALPFSNGGTGLTSASDDQVMVSSGSAWVAKTVPDCTDTAGNHINYTQSTNAFSCGTSGGGGGGAALSAITAAAASNTIASGNNHSQVWNWALTTDAVTAFIFGETTAATNGTLTQALVGINALASSTAIPLYIKNYGGLESLHIDDVSGDTTPFVVDETGKVGVGTSNPSFPIDIVSTGTSLRWGGSGSDKHGILYSDNSYAWVLSSDAVDLNLATGGGAAQFIVRNAGGAKIRFSTQASVTVAGTYLMLGDNNTITVSNYRAIGFGYDGGTNIPAFFGYQDTSSTGNGKGDLVAATRNVTTDSAPTERLRIVSDGTVNILDLMNTGSATGKKVVCVDTATGKLYASTSGTDCSS